MWAALFCTILVLSSAQVGEGVGFTPRGKKVLRTLRGGARHGDSGSSTTCSATSTTRRTAWSPPWLARRRSRAKTAKSTSVLARNEAARRASPARGSTFNSTLASIIGAILLGGGTLSLSPTVVEASPFDPRPPPKSTRQPFFEGWFIRLVDHEQRLSFAVIIGSFRGHGGEELDQHYVSLSYLHEPKGGLLPAEEENDPEEEPTAAEDVDVGGGGGGGGGEPAQARSSEIAKRFSKWIRAQRLAVLREFGAEEEEGDGGLDDPGALTKGESGAGAGQEEDQPRETEQSSDEPTGTDGDGGATAGRDEREETFDDTLLEEESEGEGQADEEVAGTTPKAETAPKAETTPDSEDGIADQGSDEEDTESDRIEGRDWLAGDGSGELMNAVGKLQAGRSQNLRASDRDTTAARDVGTVETSRTASDAIDRRAAAHEGLTDTEAKDSGVGADEPVVQPSSPSQELHSKLPGGGGSGGASLEHVAPHDEATERTHTFHAFPPADTVTILCRGEPVTGVPNLRDDPSFTWEADGIGSFAVDGDTGRLSFQLPELSVAASFRHRQPWSEERPNSAGPEGWLERTGLLPLHYFVHSMGSEAGYSLKATGAPRAVVGRGSIHMEANYGESFPTGWVWAQGCSATEGLCGNVFRDGELTTAEGGSAQEPSDGRRAAGGKADGVGGSKTDSATPRFVLTG
ncbi:unnamed protein product [Ectocarpus fasciculatus]